MKLLLVISVTIALSLADEFDLQPLDDLQAAASIDLQKSFHSTSSRYVPSRPWNAPIEYNTAIPPTPTKSANPPASQGTYFPIQNDPPQNSYYQPDAGYNNPGPSNTWDNQNYWGNNQNTAQNSWDAPQKPNYWWNGQPQNPVNNQQSTTTNQQTSQTTWNKPQNTGTQNTGSQNKWPQNTGSQNTWNNNNNQNTWNQKPSSTSTTTTPIPVIKNEQILGENGSYKYEYEIADGTHVGEKGYLKKKNTGTNTDADGDNETIVKEGFYSFKGADGKVYSVTYWADETGFHAVGDHLPKPPAIPPAIQASIDQNAKEEAAKAEAEKYKEQQQQQQIYYPQNQEVPKPIVPTPPVQIQQPQQPVNQFPQQTYYPTQQQQQQTYYPPTNYYPPQATYGRR